MMKRGSEVSKFMTEPPVLNTALEDSKNLYPGCASIDHCHRKFERLESGKMISSQVFKYFKTFFTRFFIYAGTDKGELNSCRFGSFTKRGKKTYYNGYPTAIRELSPV